MSDYQKKRRELMGWPGTSHWLAKAIEDLERRDPVNAANDAAQLLVLAQARMNEALGMPLVRPSARAGQINEPPAVAS